ncbi:DNA-directed RNA polymerase subunit epsilon [Lacticaseibacillus pantheris]|jgi:DNA-dependent RNA polymerase auxiliary subunit epsilon|uniref:DNA-directed RNA polymerase subunit epsilon n=1 Tax=Lacticaseibacillus pantheris DSM 15945 = JCM 12539 = NBRC 106106 TaxID=1423783 RepID=A0A0R1TWE1_9LACO|nr:DNA-directed RNA polymerase subunit epsilon [Lacticaseibacillus pantheris]KRL85567.1 hypothetical protein FC50_GL001739 [Lacticaseibacillus pantheris DSM 15945 = JCM 12539 = NBRC 106106]WKF85396.1 DNA-directed RNA polymerase subunit epsilon [Lacticaseibacillus pantheris]
MIYKVLYQPSRLENAMRENTVSLYLEADSERTARKLLEENTDYNIELIQPLEGKFLEYEQQSDNYKLTEF